MQYNGLVSIVMPSYNTAKYIRETIDSVLNQTYPYWELIIVDDCSNDDTDEIVKRYLSDNRIRYLKNAKNSGAAVSRNYALREAKGKWVAFLDSDDVWLSTKLEKQIEFMISKDCHFSYTNYAQMDEKSNVFDGYVTGPAKISKYGMHMYCWLGCLTAMYDAEYIGLIQIENIKKNNDYAMWLKICKKTDCYLVKETLAKYRRGRTGSISTQKHFTLIKWHYKLWREAEKKNVVSSVLYTGINLVFGFYKKIAYVKK